jgi:hypothetical protein
MQSVGKELLLGSLLPLPLEEEFPILLEQELLLQLEL